MLTKVGAVVVGALVACAAVWAYPDVKKDKRALLFFGEGLEEPILVDDRVKANLADLLIGRVWVEEVDLARADERSCIGVAVFSEKEWEDARGKGLEASELKPEMAGVRYFFFPGDGEDDPLSYEFGRTTLKQLRPETDRQLAEAGIFPVRPEELAESTCDLSARRVRSDGALCDEE